MLFRSLTYVGRLIAELSKCGVHLAPDALDAEALVKRGGGFVAKHADIEGKLCEEMAALAAGFDVAGDPAAKGLGADRCAVRLRETAAYVGTGETTMDYDTLLVERDECSRSCQNAPGATVFVEGRAKGEEYVGSLPAPAVKCQLVWGGSATGTPETDRPFDESAASGPRRTSTWRGPCARWPATRPSTASRRRRSSSKIGRASCRERV